MHDTDLPIDVAVLLTLYRCLYQRDNIHGNSKDQQNKDDIYSIIRQVDEAIIFPRDFIHIYQKYTFG